MIAFTAPSLTFFIALQDRSDQWQHFVDLVTAVNELDAAQGASQLPSFKRGEPQRVVAWLAERGVKLSNAAVAPATGLPEGDGLVAKRNLKRGEEVLRIPRSAMLVSDHLTGTPFGKDFLMSEAPSLALTLALIVESQNPKSSFRPYIESLPPSFSTMLYFTLADCAELSGSPALSVAMRGFFDAVRHFFVLQKIIADAKAAGAAIEPLSWSLYRWASSAVHSRQNNVPLASGRPGRALIPLFDLANHSDSAAEVSTEYDAEAGACVCRAPKDTAAGQQFYIYYGARPQSDLLLFSGFALSEPANPSLDIFLFLNAKEGPEYPMRVELLNKRLGMPVPAELPLREPLERSTELLRYVRVMTMFMPELKKCIADKKFNGAAITPMQDRRAHAFLVKRLQLLLENYPTSVEEDDKLLKQGAFPTPARQGIIRLRRAEKALLERIIADSK